MFVNRKKIRFDLVTSATTINVPIRLDFTPVDNSEMIEDKFVNDEVKKSINPITDYKKVRFKPAVVLPNMDWEIIDEFKIQNTFFTNDSITAGTPTYTATIPSKYGEIGNCCWYGY